jgi:hypothetical protein
MDNRTILRDLIKKTQDGAEKIALDLQPDGDWIPTAMIVAEGEDETLEITAAPIPIRDEREKELIFDILLPTLVEKMSARALTLVLPSWTSEAREEGADLRPSEDPDRRETLILIGVTLGSVESCMAPVVRSDSHPELGPWRDMATKQGARPEGWIFEGIVAAFSRSSASRN